MKPEEMHFVEAFAIYRESHNIIFSWEKIFGQIMLILVLPLCFFLFDAVVFLTLSKHTSTATYWLLKATYYTIIQIILTSRPPSSPLKKSRASTTIQNIPKYWKRVMITTLCTIIAVVLYRFWRPFPNFCTL